MNLFGLALTNPALWIGAVALGIPLAIHLLTRRTPVKIVFPTIRFLQNARASQSRLYRIRHYLLLALRTAIILLVLAAFLRPVYRARALSKGTDDFKGAATIVILDTSASMAYTGSGVSPFSKAKVAAERIIDALGTGDLANVIFASSFPEASLEEPKPGTYLIYRDIEEAAATNERSDIDGAIALALEQLAQFQDYQAEIHFVSDFQRSNWAAVNFAAIPEDVKTVFVSVAEDDPDNQAVTDVTVRPPYPAVAESVQVICKIANYSARPREIPVELAVDSGQPLRKRVLVQPGMTSTATFTLRPQSKGVYEGVVSIPNDRLRADDKRFFTMPVTERLSIAILSDSDPGDLRASPRFVSGALDPYNDGRGAFVPEVLKPEAFDQFAAANHQVTIVSDIRALSEKTAKTLLEYLRNGGGLIYFARNLVDKSNLDLLAKLSDDDFKAPFTLGRLTETGARGDTEFAMLQQANYDDPILKKFRETTALSDLHFLRYFSTTREEGQGQILLKYDNGHFALGKTNLGLGSVLLANFTPDPGGGDLVKSPVFVPLLHEMVKAMRSQSGARPFVVGAPCSTTVELASGDAPLRFTAPNGQEVNASIDMSGTEASVVIARTAEPGFYRVLAEEDLVGAIAVNVDNRESNLEALTAAQLKDISKVSKDRFYAASIDRLESFRRLREGIPIWHYLLVFALAFLAIEQLIGLRWKR